MTVEGVGAVEQTEERSAAPAIRDEPAGKSARAQAYNELYNLAKTIANTEIVPVKLQGRADAVFATMAMAEEHGISPLLGMRHIDFIQGVPVPSAMLQRALIQRAGHLLQWRRADNQAAILYGRRRDDGTSFEAVFTIEHAREQKLLGKPNWVQNPRAMLMARATSLLGRALFAREILGLEYTAEELGHVGAYDAIDLEYDPGTDRHVSVDYETGEILEEDADADDEVVTPRDMADAVDAHTALLREEAERDADDAEWLRQARDADDAADGRAAMWDQADLGLGEEP